MTRASTFDAHLEAPHRWLNELADNLELGPDELPRALHALRVGLHAIRDRLPDHEVVDLGAQLPTLIRGFYYEGWTLGRTERPRTRAAMIARVAEELGPGKRLDPVDVLRGVIHLLVEHVSAGEIEDVLATMPDAIVELWHDLTGHALADPPPAHGTMRTGFSR